MESSKDEFLKELILCYVVKKSVESKYRLNDFALLEIAQKYAEIVIKNNITTNIFNENLLRKAYKEHENERNFYMNFFDEQYGGKQNLLDYYDQVEEYNNRFSGLPDNQERTRKL